MPKPTRYFTDTPKFVSYYDNDQVAYVTINEGGVNQLLQTSRVQQKFPDGSFETLNTLYIPQNDSN